MTTESIPPQKAVSGGPDTPLELGENAKHIEEALPGSRAGVDRLLRCSQTRALGLEGADDVLQIADRAR